MLKSKLWKMPGLLFLVLCFLVSGCKTVEVLKDSALYSCGTSTVYLSGWWSNVQDKPAIEVDPMGVRLIFSKRKFSYEA